MYSDIEVQHLSPRPGLSYLGIFPHIANKCHVIRGLPGPIYLLDGCHESCRVRHSQSEFRLHKCMIVYISSERVMPLNAAWQNLLPGQQWPSPSLQAATVDI
jgi:hypothetical protein